MSDQRTTRNVSDMPLGSYSVTYFERGRQTADADRDVPLAYVERVVNDLRPHEGLAARCESQDAPLLLAGLVPQVYELTPVLRRAGVTSVRRMPDGDIEVAFGWNRRTLDENALLAACLQGDNGDGLVPFYRALRAVLDARGGSQL